MQDREPASTIYKYSTTHYDNLLKYWQKILTFIKEYIWMVNKHTKKLSIGSVIKEKQIKRTMRYHYISTTMAKIKKTDYYQVLEMIWSNQNSYKVLAGM